MATDLVELNNSNYLSRLGQLLEHICVADFVSFDFELSGIPTKLSKNSDPQFKNIPQGRPTVQHRYEEMKAAAEKYHILQVGITLGAQSEEGTGYCLEPYNVPLNPSIIHRMDIDRDVTMLGSSVRFLLENKFQIEKPFTEGVPYLSREEHQRAIKLESDRLRGKGHQNVELTDKEAGYRDFVTRTRRTLKHWKPKRKDESVVISGGEGPIAVPLNNFQRLLVHQLVRSEFKEFVTVVANGCIKVIQYDDERESLLRRNKMEAFMMRTSKQVGFRWVMEALVGGDLSDLDPVDIYMKQDTNWLDMTKVRKEMESLTDQLKSRRPVLVGHNMFMDLIFMYKTFYGPLPEKIGDFAKAIHELFPMVVDTKFLCTHSGKSDNTSLSELTVNLDKQEKPKVWTRQGHNRYEEEVNYHEAGYDSWQTARLLIKTGARLAAQTNWKQSVKKATKPGTSRPLPPGVKPEDLKKAAAMQNVEVDLISFDDEPVVGPSLSEHAQRARGHFAAKKSGQITPKDILPLEQYHLLPKPVDPKKSDPYSLPEPSQDSKFVPEWLPKWDSDFWLLFGNKIRINGTQEALLDLLAKNESMSVEEGGK